MATEYRFAPGFPNIEERLKYWGGWVITHSNGLGWYCEREKTEGRSNTMHSDPVQAHVVSILSSVDQIRNIETDTAVKELPRIWQGILVAGFVRLHSTGEICDLLKIHQQHIKEHFRVCYAELSDKLQGRQMAKYVAAQRA